MWRKPRKRHEAHCFRHKYSARHASRGRAEEVLRIMGLNQKSTKGLHPVYCKDCKGYYLENMELQHGQGQQAQGSEEGGLDRRDRKELASGERDTEVISPADNRVSPEAGTDDGGSRNDKTDTGWKASSQDLFRLFEV